MNKILAITGKEFKEYFFSPLAYVFASVFIVLTYWVFFAEFFVRSQADVRPFFNVCLFLFPIFLPALSMGRWSDEKKQGTIEILLTLPLKDSEVLLAKFFASLLVLLATLALTILLPLTVSLLGDLDWGPVWGGYLGLLFLGGLSLSIGLFISSLTESSMVAFILTFLILAILHLVGSPIVANHVPEQMARFFILLGTSSHFEPLSRGVIDLRDILYFVSATGLFLYWNLLSLGSRRWED